MEPWKAAKPYLKEAMAGGSKLYGSGGFSASPYEGNRVAGPGAPTAVSQQMIMDRARGPSLTDDAQGYLSKMMSGGFQSEQLKAAQDNALDAAIPAATAQFSGSGMLNSSQAMDTVGRVAAEATAPFAYDAMNNMQTNALRGVALTPSTEQAGYLGAQMMGAVGDERDALRQRRIDADMERYYEGELQPRDNLMGYANLAALMGGQGGTTSGSQTMPGASGAEKALGAGLGGLGTYGSLAAMGLSGPMAIAGGVGAGLLGLF
ncbi:hypothetical protein [Roseivivax jejudonensis]|nr:hypothetical protein [Roseivivax jejudonensis]